MKHQDISKDPDMIELERMIAAGELDPDRVTKYADEQPEEELKNPLSSLAKALPNCMVGNVKEYHGKGGKLDPRFSLKHKALRCVPQITPKKKNKVIIK